MQYIFFVLVVFFNNLSANEKSHPYLPLADQMGCIPTLVNGSVSAITGNYLDGGIDLTVMGSEPIIFARHYCSLSFYANTIGTGWGDTCWSEIRLHDFEKGHNPWVSACLVDTDGSTIVHSGRFHRKSLLEFTYDILEPACKGTTNTSKGILSATTNLKNSKIRYLDKEGQKLKLTNQDGGERTYIKKDFLFGTHTYYEIDKEKKPNGNQVVHEFGKNWRETIKTLSASGELLSYVRFIHQSDKEFHKRPEVRIESCDGRQVVYRFLKKPTQTSHINYLSEVESPEHPKENFEYDFVWWPGSNVPLGRLIAKRKPENRFILNAYYSKGDNYVGNNKIFVEEDSPLIDRIRLQQAPLGTDATPVISHRYYYYPNIVKDKKIGKIIKDGRTEVLDAHDNKTAYFYDDNHRLINLVKYRANGSAYSQEKFVWGSNPQSTNFGNLLERRLEDGNGIALFSRYYAYDERGNLIQENFTGNLSGKGAYGTESIEVQYFYSNDQFNLLIRENDYLKQTIYQYKPGTNLLTAKFIQVDGDIKSREFLEYDDNAAMIKKIVDDGSAYASDDLSNVTERRITYIKRWHELPVKGVPTIVEERYLDLSTGQENLISRSATSYNSYGKPTHQAHYDSDGILHYTLLWDYDSMGNLTFESDAEGRKIYREYDVNKNLIREEGPVPNHIKRHFYDFSNRKIRTEETLPDQQVLVKKWRYDHLSECFAEEDIYGNETKYFHDEFGHVIETRKPAVPDLYGNVYNPVEKAQYDLMGNVIAQTDPNGNTTRKSYNVRNQISHISYPDGSSESFTYDYHGSLLESKAKNGVITRKHYDYLKRIVREDLIDSAGVLIGSKFNTYNAFHLISSVDLEGVTTHFTYDGAGRLISIERADSLKRYEYDSLGRQVKDIQLYGYGFGEETCICKQYDLLNRVIEEKVTDGTGRVFKHVGYAYDLDGNQTTVLKYFSDGGTATYTEFNALKMPLKMVDALGNITHFTYNYAHRDRWNQTVLQEIKTDPNGNQTLTTMDAMGRKALVVKCNPFGTVLSKQEFTYDAVGNCLRSHETIMTQNGQEREVINTWEYDSGNRIYAQIEALKTPEQRITWYRYNSFGEKEAVQKPDGVLLIYTYNALGLLESYKSSDNSFSYTYRYSLDGNPIQVDDLIQNTTTKRKYDSNGRLESETLGNDLTINYQYDRMGRPTRVVLPDQSSVDYTYDAAFLREVKRGSFTHRYLEYDLVGNLLEEQLPGNLGIVQYTWDHLCRLKFSHANQRETQDYLYDGCGNLLGYQAEGKNYRFSYDDLHQLKSEEGPQSHSYIHDSAYNRVKKDDAVYTLNALNQVLSDGINSYQYDFNGNVIFKRGSEEVEYRYDALDRLTEILKGSERYVYQYDAFNRRLSKSLFKKFSENWELIEKQLFIFQGQDETGSIQDGHLIELRILGTGKGAEIGASVLMEIHGNTYIPFHNYNGNIVSLANTSGGIVEHYEFSAFGEEVIFDGNNRIVDKAISPWRFSSKRTDTETGFVYFGRRFYNPDLGRWVTTDPLGFDAGPNLYAYVFNSPLTHMDLYGLEAVGGGNNTMSIKFECVRKQRAGAHRERKRDFLLGRVIGAGIEAIGRHVVFIPYVKESIERVGCFLQKKEWKPNEHSSYRTINDHHPKVSNDVVGYWNGIMNDSATSDMQCEDISQKFGGVPVEKTFSSSHGLSTDVGTVGLEALNIRTSWFKNAYDSLMNQARKVYRTGGNMIELAFSGGGRMLYEATRYLDASVKKVMEIYTFGSAKMIPRAEFKNAVNYVCILDPVPFISDPIGILTGIFFPHIIQIKFLTPKGYWWAQHAFACPAYQEEMKILGFIYQEKNLCIMR